MLRDCEIIKDNDITITKIFHIIFLLNDFKVVKRHTCCYLKNPA